MEERIKVNIRRGGVSATESIFTTLLAASCCVGPAVFVIFDTREGGDKLKDDNGNPIYQVSIHAPAKGAT